MISPLHTCVLSYFQLFLSLTPKLISETSASQHMHSTSRPSAMWVPLSHHHYMSAVPVDHYGQPFWQGYSLTPSFPSWSLLVLRVFSSFNRNIISICNVIFDTQVLSPLPDYTERDNIWLSPLSSLHPNSALGIPMTFSKWLNLFKPQFVLL